MNYQENNIFLYKIRELKRRRRRRRRLRGRNGIKIYFRNHPSSWTTYGLFNKLTSLSYCYIENYKELLSGFHCTVFSIEPVLYCFLKVEISISPYNLRLKVARKGAISDDDISVDSISAVLLESFLRWFVSR